MADRSQAGLLRSMRSRLLSVERRIARGSFVMPGRLQPAGEQVTDWNTATGAGFYWGAGATNAPAPLEGQAQIGLVLAAGGVNATQEVSQYAPSNPQAARKWRRTWDGAAWSAWVLVSGAGDWVTATPLNSFSMPTGFPAQYSVTPTRVELSGGLYRGTAPTSFTTAFQLPASVPYPRNQVRYAGRDDITMWVAVTSDGQVQIKATGGLTSGVGYMLDGVGYAY